MEKLNTSKMKIFESHQKSLISEKKGTIGETLTWIIAILIIFFFLFIFIVTTTLLVGLKTVKETISQPFSKGIEIKQAGLVNVSALKSFESFVFSDIDVGKGVKVFRIVAEPGMHLNYAEKFKEGAGKFLDLNFNNKYYENSWIRIYDVRSKVVSDYVGWEEFSVGGSCNPDDENSIVYSYVIENNKIVFCVMTK